MINFMYMLRDVICQSFTRAVGRWQGDIGSDGKPSERKALLVLFRIERVSMQMLIHAPYNYVGVYIQKRSGKWECIAYHDSCWSSDGVEHFLYQNHENIHFRFLPKMREEDILETITDNIHVVKLSIPQLNDLTRARKKKYS